MLIYNVTTKVATPIARQWLQWMQQEHIPAVMATGCFTTYQLARLLEVDDSEGPTYAVQYSAESHEAYNRYIAEHSGVLRQEAFDKWGNAFIAFRSLMEVV